MIIIDWILKMAEQIFISVNKIAKKVKQVFIGDNNNVAQEVVIGYGSVNGKSEVCYRKAYTFTIEQSANQTITVTTNRGTYTSSFTAYYDDTWTASISAKDGYIAGNLNSSSGTTRSNVTVKASAATANSNLNRCLGFYEDGNIMIGGDSQESEVHNGTNPGTISIPEGVTSIIVRYGCGCHHILDDGSSITVTGGTLDTASTKALTDSSHHWWGEVYTVTPGSTITIKGTFVTDSNSSDYYGEWWYVYDYTSSAAKTYTINWVNGVGVTLVVSYNGTSLTHGQSVPAGSNITISATYSSWASSPSTYFIETWDGEYVANCGSLPITYTVNSDIRFIVGVESESQVTTKSSLTDFDMYTAGPTDEEWEEYATIPAFEKMTSGYNFVLSGGPHYSQGFCQIFNVPNSVTSLAFAYKYSDSLTSRYTCTKGTPGSSAGSSSGYSGPDSTIMPSNTGNTWWCIINDSMLYLGTSNGPDTVYVEYM